jgi:hypothetical protein
MKRSAIAFGLTGPMAGLGAGSAPASVTFDPAYGTGLVGKADLDEAFGGNADRTGEDGRENAGDLTFTYSETGRYVATCSWVDGPKDNPVTRVRTWAGDYCVGGDVRYELRADPRDEGGEAFVLRGFGKLTTTGDLFPEDGVPGLGARADGSWTLKLTSAKGRLYANRGGRGVLLWSEQ